MKISKHDRNMALIRIPEYQRDYAVYEELRKQGKTNLYISKFKEIKRKWNVVKPPPIKRFNKQLKENPPVIFKDESAITVLEKPEEILFYIGEQKVSQDVSKAGKIRFQEDLDDLELSSSSEKYQPIKIKHKYHYDRNNPKESLKLVKQDSSMSSSKKAKIKKDGTDLCYQGGKHLCMIVDLTKTKTELLREFEGYVKYYQKILPKSHSRNKESTKNIWDIYDMHHKDGLNFSRIAEILSGIKKTERSQIAKELLGKTSYKSIFMAYYRQVERAYKKAKRMIEQVGKEAQERK